MNKVDKINREFMNRLLNQVPELKKVYKEHQSIGGRMLPHVLMGDVTRFVISQHQLELKSRSLSPVLDRCLSFLEKAMQADSQEVQELLSVSFLENLAQSDDLYFSIRSRLGPALKAELRSYEDETGNPPQALPMPNAENPILQNAIRDFFPGTK